MLAPRLLGAGVDTAVGVDSVGPDMLLIAGDGGAELVFDEELMTGKVALAGTLLTLPLLPPLPSTADNPKRWRRTGRCSLSMEKSIPRVMVAGTTSVSTGTAHPGVSELSLAGSAMMRWNSMVGGASLRFLGFRGSKKLGLGEALLWWAMSLVM